MPSSSRPPRIEKPAFVGHLLTNLQDYETLYATFDWKSTRIWKKPNINIAWAAAGRHVDEKRGDEIALRFLHLNGNKEDFSYGKLWQATQRFASMLKGLGVERGETVFSLLGRVPELYVAALGTLAHSAVFCPLFSAFGPKPVFERMKLGNARVLLTTPHLYETKIRPHRTTAPHLPIVLLTGDHLTSFDDSNVFWLNELLRHASDNDSIPDTPPETPALLHFTSGTTGTPKGALHVHQAALSHYLTGRWALDFQRDDIFWCTADPGWVTGTSYGIIAPLTHGITTLVDEAEFDVTRWYQTLSEEAVNVWYTSPTAIRLLMKAGPQAASGFDFSHLRLIASVGEPLNPEAVWFGKDVFQRPIHDNYWQTETGGIMVSNFASMDIKPGSMGRPLPGIEAAIVRRVSDTQLEFLSPGTHGELAFRKGWPSMFRGYIGEEARYRKCFVGDYYLTGDWAYTDDEGYFWFVGRADDVIKSAGHMVGPFEVESALMEHPSVAEVAVIGVPNALVGETVKAFVSLKNSFSPSKALEEELLGFARKRLGSALAPKQVVFLPVLPRTRSGKLLRRLLKARELGLPEGDLSTLEQPA